ncbi:MAG: hypothetical protein JWO53_1154 [Chlamydiia bacterium]|nr:hypothetical protein [Chlamydiia bacterium]
MSAVTSFASLVALHNSLLTDPLLNEKMKAQLKGDAVLTEDTVKFIANKFLLVGIQDTGQKELQTLTFIRKPEGWGEKIRYFFDRVFGKKHFEFVPNYTQLGLAFDRIKGSDLLTNDKGIDTATLKKLECLKKIGNQLSKIINEKKKQELPSLNWSSLSSIGGRYKKLEADLNKNISLEDEAILLKNMQLLDSDQLKKILSEVSWDQDSESLKSIREIWENHAKCIRKIEELKIKHPVSVIDNQPDALKLLRIEAVKEALVEEPQVSDESEIPLGEEEIEYWVDPIAAQEEAMQAIIQKIDASLVQAEKEMIAACRADTIFDSKIEARLRLDVENLQNDAMNLEESSAIRINIQSRIDILAAKLVQASTTICTIQHTIHELQKFKTPLPMNAADLKELDQLIEALTRCLQTESLDKSEDLLRKASALGERLST